MNDVDKKFCYAIADAIVVKALREVLTPKRETRVAV